MNDLFTPPPAEPPTQWVPAPAPRTRHPRRIGIWAALIGVLALAGVAVALLALTGRDASVTPVSAVAGGGLDADVDQLLGADAPPPAAPAAPDAARAENKLGGAKRLGDDTLLLGSVVSTGNGTIVVAQDNGKQLTVRTDGATRFLGAARKGLTDLQAGERIVVRVHGTGDAATAVTVLTPRGHVAGTVTAVTGDTATVLRGDGLSVPVNLAAINPKPAVGDVVLVVGHTDGSTVVAEHLKVLPKTS